MTQGQEGVVSLATVDLVKSKQRVADRVTGARGAVDPSRWWKAAHRTRSLGVFAPESERLSARGLR